MKEFNKMFNDKINLMPELNEKYAVRKEFKKIIGIDIAPKSKEVREGDCTQLVFRNYLFDTVFLIDVIEHLETKDLYKCLDEVQRVLKLGGYAIITTDYDEDLDNSQVTCPYCNHQFHRWGHIQSFDENIIKSIIPDNLKIMVMKRIDFGRRLKHPGYKYLDSIINKGGLYIVLKKV